ncbi:uncharacterized protein K441DRAFT_659615 [Cenococcum geophilum 1.58]|uniref:uncharacterized protein n=1 Tax=Cenococcum geophilum 1.58 TaxID=794803 RepID=UPI00358F5B31|nr:hypothetical protein K441DRAFT_659615 [Cenococcum geophilum 1.58]
MGKPRVVSQFEGLEHHHQILQNPPDLKQWRQRLHDVAEPLRLTKAEFDTYFPYVSNVWSYQKKYIRKDGVEIQHWNCRMQPQTNKSIKDIGNILKDKDEKAKKTRSKKIRDGGTCKSFLRIEILLDSYTLSLTGDPHKHDLDYMDQIKRNNALRLRCEHEIWRQRQPAEILAALQGSTYMQDGRKQLTDAGGEYLKL